MPQLSVLMPVRNGAQWVGQSIDSVLAQTFADFELIVVDDGSTDETPGIIADYAKRDPRIVVLTQPSRGLVAALNEGLAAARAPLLARLDADDLAEPTRFAEQMAAMQADPRMAVLGSWATEIDEAGRVIGTRRPEADAAPLRRAINSANPMIHSAVMLRVDLARAVGAYRNAFAAAEDFDLWLRMSEVGAVANLPRELVRYRVHANSVSSLRAFEQLFATRLVHRSAVLRREGRRDPATDLKEALRLWDTPPPEYGEAFAIFRALAWSEPATMPASFKNVAPDFALLKRSHLSRREARIAQRAILNFIAAHPGTAKTELWMDFIKLRPSRALSLLAGRLFGRKAMFA